MKKAGAKPAHAGTPGYDDDGNPLKQGVVAATSVMAGTNRMGGENPLSKRLEEAMVAAIEAAQKKGLPDKDVKKAILDARKRVMEEVAAEEEAARVAAQKAAATAAPAEASKSK